MKVREGLVKYISPKTSRAVRMEAARCFSNGETHEVVDQAKGGDPGAAGGPGAALKPNDQVTVLFALCYDRDPEVAETARASLDAYPVTLVLRALGHKLDPAVLKKLANICKDNAAVLTMVALNPGADTALLENLAETGPSEVVVVLAEDRFRLAKCPSIAEKLRKNPKAPRELLESLLCSPARTGEEEREELAPALEEEEDENLAQRLANMSVAEKVKLAMTGDKFVRTLLIKDSNKMISTAVIKNPRLTEAEVVKITASKTTPDDILRLVARNKQWLKNYNIRVAMVMNAKTPLPVSMRLLDSLNTMDLAKAAKSKYIPHALAGNAGRILAKKKR